MTTGDQTAVAAAAIGTPLHVGAVGLVVRDLDLLVDYYRDVLGLAVTERSGETAILGAGGVTLLELRRDAGARPDDQRQAGLYHTAFVMPTRADLARWILHLATNRVPITGASDHDVSEAIYLDDPEGNGIEVYGDRPPERWRREGKTIFQKTDPLDVDDILREIDPETATYDGAPEGLRVGHIHLRVGSIDEAEKFYCDLLGLDVTRRRTGATFISSGGYHHHVGANVWHSDGAGVRGDGQTGLDWFSLEAVDEPTLDEVKDRIGVAGVASEPIAGGFALRDPSGIRIEVTTGA